MNHLMTLGLDRRWRRHALRDVKGGDVLDVACGTGDLTIELLRRGCHAEGIDLSAEMMAIAQHKCENLRLPSASYCFQVADAEHLPYADGCFDLVSSAFGVRNFVHIEQGLAEMRRVLKPGGQLLLLELSTPDHPFMRFFYHFYARHGIPLLGSLVAHDRAAYTYLPASIEHFPKGQAMIDILRGVGYSHVEQQKYTFGVCRCYRAQR